MEEPTSKNLKRNAPWNAVFITLIGRQMITFEV